MSRKKIAPSRPTLTLLAALLGALVAGAPPAGADEVIDGDTLVVQGQRMRLSGVDAFELEQTCLDRQGRPWHCGTAAKAAMAELVQGEAIACTVVGAPCLRARCPRG
jgi:endonuclease YncB( thermonuclease family)